MTASFHCPTCDESHEGLPTDLAWRLPDDVWAVPEAERDARARFSADLCDMDGRFFVRGVLKVSFQSIDGYYGWGAWVEVAEHDFNRYLALFREDASGEPAVDGRLANDIPGYGGTLGMPVSVRFGTAAQRPTFTALQGSTHPLAREQRDGMSNARYHDILVATGVIDAS